jgi:hypothetical protein
MRIPVFISAPTALTAAQGSTYKAILSVLGELGLERRALGRSDYPVELPLKEVMQIARRCSGGVILGFVQFHSKSGIVKPGIRGGAKSVKNVVFPTPWNQLEAGILFSLRLPLLVFKEDGISGGVFDAGVTDVFVHPMPSAGELKSKTSPVREVLLKWQSLVRDHYYNWEG